LILRHIYSGTSLTDLTPETDWGIAPISTFSSTIDTSDHEDDPDACGELADIMNSNKNFVVVSAQDPIKDAAKVLLDKMAVDQSCKREKKKPGAKSKSSCPETEAADAEEAIENPVSLLLDMVLPICMG
jgi:hypothetical protein